MKWEKEAYAITRIGSDHIKVNKICQDFSLVKQEKKWTLIAVSDGHGGKDYVRSHLGAQFACEAVEGVLRENPPSGKTFFDDYAAVFKEKVLLQWKLLVGTHLGDNPFVDEELEQLRTSAKDNYLQGIRTDAAYGCTLAFALITDYGAMYGQVGDSECYARVEGDVYEKPLPDDEDCQFNVTTSLCSSNALEKFRCGVSAKIPKAVFLMSDGVANSFAKESFLIDFLKLSESSFKEETDIQGKKAVEKELGEFLSNLSKKGSGDDVSLACAFCQEKELLDYLPLLKKWIKREGTKDDGEDRTE